MVLDGLMSVASALGMGPQAATRTTGLRPTPPLTKPKATSMPPEAQPSLSSPKSPAGGLVPGNKNRMNNLTCPFCASAACFIDRSMAPGAYYVRCGQCCTTGPTFDTEDKAISAWENLLNRLDRKTISLRISPEIVSATSLVEGFGYALQNIVEALDRQARQEGLTPQQKDTIQQIADGLRKPCILAAFTQSECVQRARIKSPQ